MPSRASPFNNTKKPQQGKASVEDWQRCLLRLLSRILCQSDPASLRRDCPAGFEPQLFYLASVLLLPHVLLLSVVIFRLRLARSFYVGA